VSNRTTPSGISARERGVLRAIVERYIESAEPVASGSLSQSAIMGEEGKSERVSSATIRNSMARLEQLGLIASPHTSAGRIPTSAGIALYTSELMQPQALSRSEMQHAETMLAAPLHSTSLLSAASRGLSGILAELAVCMAPRFGATVFDHIEFVRVSSQRLVAIFVARTGAVYNRLLDIEQDVNTSALDRINSIMRESFCGLSLVDIRSRLASELLNERARADDLYRRALELGYKGAPDNAATEVFIDGAAHCIAHKEIALDAERLRQLVRTVEEKTQLLRWLERVPSDMVRVTLSDEEPLLGMALVTAPYNSQGGERGVLGILGPQRMNYARIVPMVAFSASTITRKLLGGSSEE